MSFLDKYEDKKPTVEDIKSLDSQVVTAAKSGALGRIMEKTPDVLKDYIDSAKELFRDKAIESYVLNIEHIMESIRGDVEAKKDGMVTGSDLEKAA